MKKKMQAELSQLYKPSEAAALLRVSPQTLHNWRVLGRGPRFIRMGGRIVYAKNDLAAYVAARSVQSTSEPLED